MNKKIMFSSLMMTAALGASVAHSAQILDNTWFETQIKGTIPKAKGIVQVTSNFNVLSSTLTTDKIKFDSGKKACFSHVVATATAPANKDYDVNTFCLVGAEWEFDSSWSLQDTNDGFVANPLFEVSVPVNGDSFFTVVGPSTVNNNPNAQTAIVLETLILQPKIKSGSLNRVTTKTKTSGLDAFIDRDQTPTGAGTQTVAANKLSGFKFNFVKDVQADVPNGAIGCAAVFEGVVTPASSGLNPAQVAKCQ